MERRSLYHSLRVNWQLDPSLQVKPWQVEDYRKTSLEALFTRLKDLGIALDYARFMVLADAEESPEDFAETLLPDQIEDQEVADQIYLIIFELWRRFLSERQTLSILCDEWDHQIDLYESQGLSSLEGLSDVIGKFKDLLEDAEDQKENPKALYDSVMQECAHDVESFLYDFASVQIEEQNFSYAEEIIEAFLPYAEDKHWLKLLQAEILFQNDAEAFSRSIQQLLKESAKLNDLSFNLEFLAYLAKKGEDRFFLPLVKLILPRLHSEEDFWDLLSSCEDFFHYQDDESNDETKESWIKNLRLLRFKNDPEQSIYSQDPDILKLKNILFH